MSGPVPLPDSPAVPSFPRLTLWGLPLARVNYDEAVELVDALVRRRQPSYFITANLNYAMLSHRDSRLAGINQRAAFITADGMPLVWYAQLLGRPLPGRVTGIDLTYRLCALAASRGYRLFLLGGEPGVARQAAENLCRLYPGLQIAGVASPTLGQLTPDAHAALLEEIRQSRADILLAAFGQPKGELWLDANCQALGVPVCAQLGATLDFLAGNVRRAPRRMQRLGLEWIYRMTSDPRRLGPRYARNIAFLMGAVCRDLRNHFRGGPNGEASRRQD